MNPWKGALLVAAGAALGALGYAAVDRASGPDADDTPATAKPAELTGLRLTAEQQRAAQIAVAPLAGAASMATSQGYARAIDLAPLAAIAGDVTTAKAAAAASSREAARLVALVRDDAGASRRELETAQATARGDEAKLTAACRRLGLEFGPGLARLGCDAAEDLAREAAAGQLALLRVDFPGQALPAGTSVTLDLAPGEVAVRLLGPTSAGDTQLQSSGMLALLRGPLAARLGVGRIVTASRAAGRPRPGVLVPREAIVRSDGGLFAWRPLGPGRFERISLEGATADPRGWIVPVGALRPGQPIVVHGAGTLLGLEHAVAPAGSDD